MLCFKDSKSLLYEKGCLAWNKKTCKMIQKSIFSGSSPASRKVTCLWRGLCQPWAHAAGISSRQLSLHCSLETQMQTENHYMNVSCQPTEL